MPRLPRSLRADVRGATMVEYLIVLAVVSVAGLFAWSLFASALTRETSEQTASVLAMSGSSSLGASGVLPPPSVAEGASGEGAHRGSLTSTRWDASVPLALRLTEGRGSATGADVARVHRALERMPPGVLRELEELGVKVVVGRESVTDAVPSLKGVRPRGWPEGKTWDSVDGAYYPNDREVVVATTRRGRRGRGLTRRDSELVLHHEIGHALDYRSGYPSRSPAFRAAYEADKAKLTGYESQGGHAGPEEAFAESFRRYITGDPNLRKHQPHLWAYWNSDPLGMFGTEAGD